MATTAVPVGRARGRDRTSAMLLAVHDAAAAAAALLASVAVVVVAVAAALATLVASAESHVHFLLHTVPFADSHVTTSPSDYAHDKKLEAHSMLFPSQVHSLGLRHTSCMMAIEQRHT